MEKKQKIDIKTKTITKLPFFQIKFSDWCDWNNAPNRTVRKVLSKCEFFFHFWTYWTVLQPWLDFHPIREIKVQKKTSMYLLDNSKFQAVMLKYNRDQHRISQHPNNSAINCNCINLTYHQQQSTATTSITRIHENMKVQYFQAVMSEKIIIKTQIKCLSCWDVSNYK